MGYWDATDEYLREHGGEPPTCGFCGQQKFAIDDHGRFGCFCADSNVLGGFGMRSSPTRMAQVDATGMSDAEKATIPPLNRLDAPPTEKERQVLDMLLKGPDAMGDSQYIAACQDLDEERRG